MKISRDGVGLGYADAGHGDPPILLVHGWGTDRAVMKPLFDWARGSRRVIAVDLRGFGESDAPEQPYTIQAYSDDLFFIASRVGLRQPIVIGHSMGGLIALDFAARHAAELSAAVVLEPMAIAPELLAGLRPILAGVRTEGYREVVAGLMGYLTGPHLDPGARAGLVDFIRACRQHVLISAMEGILSFDSEAAAASVTCPLLYVGTNTTYANIARFRELCPQLVTGQVVGCGHYFPLEVPDQLTAMVARFIETNVASQVQVSPHPPTDFSPEVPE